jgi:hypothetical protein
MFAILNVLIGPSFVYLVFSLVMSANREMVGAINKAIGIALL